MKLDALCGHVHPGVRIVGPARDEDRLRILEQLRVAAAVLARRYAAAPEALLAELPRPEACLDRAVVLAQAPAADGVHFLVPPVVDTRG